MFSNVYLLAIKLTQGAMLSQSSRRAARSFRSYPGVVPHSGLIVGEYQLIIKRQAWQIRYFFESIPSINDTPQFLGNEGPVIFPDLPNPGCALCQNVPIYITNSSVTMWNER